MEDNREKENRTKKYALIALLLALIACSFGFAAYSRSIDYMNRDNDRFVFFKSGVLSIKPNEPQNGMVRPTSTKGAIAEEAELTENGIININVHFTEPGQTATYAFFGVNPTEHPSYLNSVVFGDKYCMPVGETTQEEADEACGDITMTISIKSDAFKETNGIIDDHILPAKSNEPISVTLKYNPVNKFKKRSFKVDFGTSTLTYSQVD